ncbi:hypothetical protein O9929_11935 [Vibrio lentus]|nr:hypothetical protein [Vibrio lentus]
MIIIGIVVGLGIATTAVITARAIGANETRYAKQLGGLVIAMGSVSVALFSVIIYLLRANFTVVGCATNGTSIIDSYWIYWLVSSDRSAALLLHHNCVVPMVIPYLPGSMMIATSIISNDGPDFHLYARYGRNAHYRYGVQHSIFIVAPKVIKIG